MQAEVVAARAKCAMAVQKLVPVGEYLDLAEAGILEQNPTRFQALSVAAMDIVRRFRSEPLLRDACITSGVLSCMLENVDFEFGEGALSRQPANQSV